MKIRKKKWSECEQEISNQELEKWNMVIELEKKIEPTNIF